MSVVQWRLGGVGRIASGERVSVLCECICCNVVMFLLTVCTLLCRDPLENEMLHLKGLILSIKVNILN